MDGCCPFMLRPRELFLCELHMRHIQCTRRCRDGKTWFSRRKPAGDHRAPCTGIEITAIGCSCYNERAVRGAPQGKEHLFGRVREAFQGGGSVW